MIVLPPQYRQRMLLRLPQDEFQAREAVRRVLVLDASRVAQALNLLTKSGGARYPRRLEGSKGAGAPTGH